MVAINMLYDKLNVRSFVQDNVRIWRFGDLLKGKSEENANSFTQKKIYIFNIKIFHINIAFKCSKLWVSLLPFDARITKKAIIIKEFFFVRGSERKSIKMPIDMCVYVRVGVCV